MLPAPAANSSDTLIQSRIQETKPDFRLFYVHAACFLVVPLDCLKDEGWFNLQTASQELNNRTAQPISLVKYCKSHPIDSSYTQY